MLPAYDALVTDDKSPIYRYAKRAYYIIDKTGTVRWTKVEANPLDLLDPAEVLKALKESGVGCERDSPRPACSRRRSGPRPRRRSPPRRRLRPGRRWAYRSTSRPGPLPPS